MADRDLVLEMGPRRRRILLLLVQHPEWDTDETIDAIRIRFLHRSHDRDPGRLVYKLETRECEVEPV